MKRGLHKLRFGIIWFLCFALLISNAASSVFRPIEPMSKNEPVDISINNSDISLNNIEINSKKEISKDLIEISKIAETSELKIGLPVGRLYQAFDVSLPNADSEIINITFEFRINKTWLNENNITVHFNPERYWLVEDNVVGNMKLFRKPEGYNFWIPLNTSFSREDRNFFYFKSYSPAFSTFAVYLNKYDCLPNSARCEGNKVQLCLGNSTWLVTETCSAECKEGKCESFFFQSDEFFVILITIVMGIIFILLILLFSRIIKKKK